MDGTTKLGLALLEVIGLIDTLRSTEFDIPGQRASRAPIPCLGYTPRGGTPFESLLIAQSSENAISLPTILQAKQSLPPPAQPCEGKLGSKRELEGGGLPGRDDP